MNPSVLSPYFVVQQLKYDMNDQPYEMRFYKSNVETPLVGDPETPKLVEVDPFTKDKFEAMLFTNLHAAVRVARSEGAEVRVLTSKEDLTEFRR